MKIVVLIPARSGSKRVPGKNVRPLMGIPLMEWSIRTAEKISWIHEVYVSTDAELYKNLAEDMGAQGILRGTEAASDKATDADVIWDFLKNFSSGPDLIVYLRPTTPFREVEMVDGAISWITGAGHIHAATSLRSVEEMGESAFKTFQMAGPLLKSVVGSMGLANLPNQLVPKTYRGNGYVDIIKTSQVLETGDLWGDRCLAYPTSRVIEIDTAEDFEYAQWWAENRRGKE